jgi:CelD/BcsL family acetyltransferase involved in cellulose biosynthesis
MSGDSSQIKFVIGSRKVAAVSRRLKTVNYSLRDLTDGTAPAFPALAEREHGYRILSAPSDSLPQIYERYPGYIIGGLQHYQRYYIDMAGSYDDYLGRFSSKTRSTFNRKRRKLAEHFSDSFEIREYRSPEEMTAFLAEAIPLSRRTYQARLLDAGLPESDTARAAMLALAATDQVRAYLCFAEGRAVSYLYLPIDQGVISYAFLGYDPAIANFSPGTVLQLEALDRLYAEGRYRYFDFTEGEGAHKAMFGTDSVAACSFFLLKPALSNRLLMAALCGFDGGVAMASKVAERSGLNARLRRLLRG